MSDDPDNLTEENVEARLTLIRVQFVIFSVNINIF